MVFYAKNDYITYRRITGDRFTPFPGEEDERQIRIVLTDGLEIFEIIHLGHLVVRDEAVDVGRRNSLKSVGCAGSRFDTESAVFPLGHIGC